MGRTDDLVHARLGMLLRRFPGRDDPDEASATVQRGVPGGSRVRAWVVLGGLMVLVVGVAALVRTPLARLTSPPIPVASSGAGQPAALSPLVVAGATGDDGSVPPGSPTPSGLVVHVTGEVRRPGVVTLPVGSRVADAVAAAGGVRRGGSLGSTNLARLLVDGERIEVGGRSSNGSVGGAATAGPVDLNSATAEQLDALPGIGPVTAAKILAWRSQNGRFSVVEELAEVPGIGPRTLAELRPLVRV